MFFLPGRLPPEAQARDVTVERGNATQAAFGAVVGRPAGGDRYRDVVRVFADVRSGEAQSDDQSSAVSVGGRTWHYTDPGGPSGASLELITPGMIVTVLGPPGSRQVITDVAGRLGFKGDDPTGIGLAGVPEGYRLVASTHHGRFDAQEAHFGAGPPDLGNHVAITLIVDAQVVPAGTYRPELLTLGTTLESLRVRGHPAVVASTGDRNFMFAWLERPDLVVTVLVSGVDRAAALDIVHSLRSVDEATFRAAAPTTTSAP